MKKFVFGCAFFIICIVITVLVSTVFSATLLPRTGLYIPATNEQNWHVYMNPLINRLETYGGFTDLYQSWGATQVFSDIRLPTSSYALSCSATPGKMQVRSTGALEWCDTNNTRRSTEAEIETQVTCLPIEDINANDDNFEFFIAKESTSIKSVGCRCRGTCTTKATFQLENRGGTAMGGTPTCATTENTTFTSLTSNNIITSGDGLAFDVTNTPTTGDAYTLCVTHADAGMRVPVCRSLPDINENDDDYEFWMAGNNVTVQAVGCHCRGTCTTPAQLRFQDRGNNVMSPSTTCSSGSGQTSWTSIVSGGSLAGGEGLAFDVTNTPTTGDVYTICFTYQ